MGLALISYIAWEPSAGGIDGLSFEVGKTHQVTRHQFQTILFQEIFAEPPIFLADIQNTRGGNPLNLRWEARDLDGIAVKIDDEPPDQEAPEQSADEVGYIVIR